MRCDELMKKLETQAPPCCACDWDNVGLLAGRHDKEIKRILISLDATDEAVDEAVSLKADLLLTHHPLIFKPLKRINDGDFISRRLLRMISHDVNYYAMHTNFDSAPGCMADAAAERLGLLDQEVLEPEGVLETGEENITYGIGKVGRLPSQMTIKELGRLVKERFGLPFLTMYGENAVKEPVTRVAIAPGSGRGSIAYAEKAGAQVLITGDIGHHEGIDAAANHLAILDGGHYGLEHIFIDYMADYLERECSGQFEIHKMAVEFPADII